MSLGRIYYSKDGTIAWALHPGDVTRGQMSSGNLTKIDSDPNNSQWVSLYDHVWAGRGIAWNFPVPVSVSKFGFAMGSGGSLGSFLVQYSLNSTTGLDGTWTTLSGPTTHPASTYLEYSFSPVSTQWLRFHCNSPIGTNGLRAVLIFGEYTSERFQFWDVTETIKLSTDSNYPLSLPDAPNNTLYGNYKSFKIKNNDAATHSYTVYIDALKVGGDSIVSNYFRLSSNGGGTKTTTLTISNLAPGAFSTELRLYVDVPSANNPADGYHYYAVRVEETA